MQSLHPSSEPESRWGGPRTILALVLAAAAALRLVGVRYGLPHGNLLNPDEESIVPRAWAMTHGGGVDPHPFFDYPSLLLYLLAPFQWWQDTPSYLSARLVAVAIGVVGVAVTWRLGERAYGVVAGGVAAAAVAVATVHVAYSRMAVTDVLLTTLVTIALVLLVGGHLEWAGLVAGVAAAAKYPGALLLVPIVVVGWGRWRRVAIAAALLVLAFVLGSPFSVVHAGESVDDYWRTAERARRGWLGFEHEHAAPIAFADRLWESLGPVVVVGVVGLVVALVRRGRADVVLASWTLAYFATLLPLEAHFDRYVLPIVPALAVLAARFTGIAAVLALLLVVPLTWSVRDTRELTKTDTRVVAARRYAKLQGLLAVDPSLPVPPRREVVRLSLPAPWREADPLRDVGELRARGVVYLALTGAVGDRVVAARDEYPQEAFFYEAFRSGFRRVFRLDPGGSLAGPWVEVFQLTSER